MISLSPRSLAKRHGPADVGLLVGAHDHRQLAAGRRGQRLQGQVGSGGLDVAAAGRRQPGRMGLAVLEQVLEPLQLLLLVLLLLLLALLERLQLRLLEEPGDVEGRTARRVDEVHGHRRLHDERSGVVPARRMSALWPGSAAGAR